MTEFLIGAAFVAVISTIVGVALWIHAEKQEREFKTRNSKKQV